MELKSIENSDFLSPAASFWEKRESDPSAAQLLAFSSDQIQSCLDASGKISADKVWKLAQDLQQTENPQDLLQAVFLFHLLADLHTSSQVILARSFLLEAEKILQKIPEDVDQRAFVDFSLQEKQLSFLIENNNYDEADRLVDLMWKAVMDADSPFPNWIVGVFVNNALEVYSEQGKREEAQQIIQAVVSGQVSISDDKKRSFLIKSAKLEADDDKAFRVLEAFMGDGSSPLTDLVKTLQPDQQREDCSMWATREWLLRHPDRSSVAYQEQRDNFFNQASGFNRDSVQHGSDWKAQILKQEALDHQDPALLREAIDFYTSCEALAFHRVGAELLLLREFDETLDGKAPKDVILEAWGILEAQLGRRVVEYFIESIPGAKDAVERVIGTVEEGSTPTRTRRMLMHCRPLPTYLQDLAQVIIDVYHEGNEDSLDTFRRAARDYYRSRRGGVQQEHQQLEHSVHIESNRETLLHDIEAYFGLEGTWLDNTEGGSDETDVQSYVLENGEASLPHSAWRQVLTIKSPQGVCRLRKATDPALFPEQIKMIEALLHHDKNQESPFEGSVRVFLSPKVGATEILHPEEVVARGYLPKIQEIYASAAAVPAAPEADQWIIVSSENQRDVLASLALTPLQFHSIPFLFKGILDEDSCQQYLSDQGVSCDQCMEAGTFGLDPFVTERDLVLVSLFFQAAQQILEEGKTHVVAIANRSARKIYKHYGLVFQSITLPSGIGGAADYAKREACVRKVLGMSPDQFALCDKNYIQKGTQIVVLEAQQVFDILRQNYPQFCTSPSSP